MARRMPVQWMGALALTVVGQWWTVMNGWHPFPFVVAAILSHSWCSRGMPILRPTGGDGWVPMGPGMFLGGPPLRRASEDILWTCCTCAGSLSCGEGIRRSCGEVRGHSCTEETGRSWPGCGPTLDRWWTVGKDTAYRGRRQFGR